MKSTHLYNTAHPLAESGKPIFIPFGEWNYDGQSRQRLDRAHGEKIANELNARVAKGDPGIPVYQGHPDVPALAAKYPDKGALGWVVRAELVNEGGKDGLALTVEWDRDPGRGFRWFSPYWLANSREGGTYIVDEIASIGLVNNPNIPEFRLANEEQHTKKKLNPAIIELAARHDRLANEANFDESKHPRSDDGKFTSGGGSGGTDSGKKEGRSSGGLKTVIEQRDETEDLFNRSVDTGDEFSVGGTYNPFQTVTDSAFDALKSRANIDDDDMDEPVIRSIVTAIAVSSARDALKMKSKSPAGYAIAIAHVRANEAAKLLNKARSIDAIKGVRDKVLTDNGFSVARYDRLANEANFDESKHPRSDDGKFTSGGGGGGKSESAVGDQKSVRPLADRRREAESKLPLMRRIFARASTPESINRNANELRRAIALAKKGNKVQDLYRGVLSGRMTFVSGPEAEVAFRRALIADHKKAISYGYYYNPKTHQYE